MRASVVVALAVGFIAVCFQMELITFKRMAIGGLALYKAYNKQVLAMQGLTPDDAAHARVTRSVSCAVAPASS
jgi:hypothetical protein